MTTLEGLMPRTPHLVIWNPGQGEVPHSRIWFTTTLETSCRTNSCVSPGKGNGLHSAQDHNRLVNRLVQVGILAAFLVVLAELARQLATRRYSPFGIWASPHPDETLGGGIVILAALVFLMARVRRRV